jgi:hypothetical protein
MHKLPQTDAPASGGSDDADHVDREKKIGNLTIRRLLRSVRRIVEESAWDGGMIWYPDEMLRRVSPSKLAEQVFPDLRTPAARVCTQAIRSYIEKPLNENEARGWLAKEIDKRLYEFVIGARNKLCEIRLVVTESKIRVRAERPDTTRKAVGPAPWTSRL